MRIHVYSSRQNVLYYSIINNILFFSLFAAFDVISFKCSSVVISQSVSLSCSSSMISHIYSSGNWLKNILIQNWVFLIKDFRFQITEAEFRIAYYWYYFYNICSAVVCQPINNHWDGWEILQVLSTSLLKIITIISIKYGKEGPVPVLEDLMTQETIFNELENY